MKPPARSVVGHLIWSTDGGVWALWRVWPFAHAHTATSDKLAVHGRLRGLLMGLPTESMLLSVCERLDPWDIAADMLEGSRPTAMPPGGRCARRAPSGWPVARSIVGATTWRPRYRTGASPGGKPSPSRWVTSLRHSGSHPRPSGHASAKRANATPAPSKPGWNDTYV